MKKFQLAAEQAKKLSAKGVKVELGIEPRGVAISASNGFDRTRTIIHWEEIDRMTEIELRTQVSVIAARLSDRAKELAI